MGWAWSYGIERCFADKDIRPLCFRPPVEILSEGNRKLDETIKRQRYEHYGIPEYWIIDPALDQLKIYRLVNGRYSQASVLSLEVQEQLATPLLPTLSLPLATLFK